MSLDSLRNGIVYSMQMNNGTIDSSGQNTAGTNNGATTITQYESYFKDDFTGTSVDTTKWSTITSGGTITVADGKITLSQTASNGNASIISNTTHTPYDDVDLEYEVTKLAGAYRESAHSIFRDATLNAHYSGWGIASMQTTYDSTLRIYVRNSDSVINIYNIKTSWTPQNGKFNLKYYYNSGSPYVELYFNDTLQGSHTLTTTEKTYLLAKTKTEFKSMITVANWTSNLTETLEYASVDVKKSANIPDIKLGTGAYSFDGVNDVIRVTGYNANFNNMSMSAWIKIHSWTNYDGVLMIHSGAVGGYHGDKRIGFGHGGDADSFEFILSPTDGGKITYSTFCRPSLNEWHYIVGVRESGTLKIYLDGQFISSLSENTGTFSFTNGFFDIGQNSYTNGAFTDRFFDGIIDDVNIWNRALSSSEITELYNNGDGLELFPGVADGVISAYKFDGDATDSALSGNDGTVYGATAITTGQKLGTGAYSFDGVNDEITFPIELQNVFSGTNHYTYSVWFNINSMTRHTIIDFTSNTSGSWTNGSLWVSLLNDGRIVIARANGSTWNEGTTTNIITETNKWYHFLLTYDGSNMKLYINNSLVLTVASTLSATIASAYRGIGVYRGEGFVNYWFNGLMDESTTWNRALSSDEIVYLYNSGTGLQYDFIIEEISGYLIKRYNGTSWEEYPVKVYNGTDWVDAKVKRYNGTSWDEL